ncbi:hypothetical protein LV779_19265 [Streptomyces thinghirensis]|nr:hypothetical protein [Streptomyces thinghirensis]
MCDHTSRLTRDAFEYAGTEVPLAARPSTLNPELPDLFPPGSFVGREAELQTLQGLLQHTFPEPAAPGHAARRTRHRQEPAVP